MAADTMAFALEFAVRLVAVGLAITGAELVADRSAFAATGPFSPQVFLALRGADPPRALTGATGLSIVAGTQVVAAVGLVVVGPMPVLGRCALVVLLLTTMTIRRRKIIGGDGAEQMSDIVLIAAVLALLPVPGDTRIMLAVIFIAAQAVLSYFTAGVAKLISPIWRTGGAMPAILGTYGHGLAPMSRLMASTPALGLVLGWAVIVFEVSFPLVLLTPLSIAIGILAIGVTFHLGSAAVMGLNSFVWPFPATYACVLAARASLIG
jgi:hypothetical protein